jgi:HEAT repeat protein/energy-coupling factor transporter ATP-binding protein EcfA2
MTIRNLPAGIAPPAYLESLHQNDRFKDCRELYTSTQAQIPLQVQARKEQKERRPGEPESQQPEPPREPPVEVLEGLRDAVQKHRQVLLIGKPGSGKTTALRRLVWEGVSAWARGRVDDQDSPIPVFVELRGRDGKSAKAVLEWIQDALEMHDQDISPDEIEQLLKQDQLLLLFDGVNEASSESVSALDAFRERYPKTPMIFTTRELGAGQVLGVEKKLEMVPLSVEEMRSFIDKRLRGESEKLINAMGDRLRELAETPLLLNMFCEVYKPEQPIPQNRGELFRQFAQLYDERHKRRCQYEAIAYPDFYDFRDEVLQQLAFEMMQGHEKPEGLLLQIDRTDAEKLIERVFHQRGVADAPTKVKKWLDGLVRFHLLQVASHPNQIEFHHQLFQEYYAAEALLPKLADLTEDQLKCHYLNYLKWTEPLAMTLALEPQEAQSLKVVKLALETDWMLGARLIGEAQQDFQYQLIELITALEVPDHLEVELLELTHAEVAIVNLTKLAKAQDPDVRGSAVEALLNIGGEKSTSIIFQALEDPEAYVRWRAAEALGRIGSEKALQVLSENLQHPNNSIRQSAINALGQIGNEASILLLCSVLRDPDTEVRWSASQALKNVGSEKTIPRLQIALNNQDSNTRLNAALGLGHLGNEAGLFELLKALNHSDPNIRSSVVEAFGKISGENAVYALKQALQDPDKEVRICAVWAFQEIGNNQAIAGLSQALQDPEYEVRHEAASLLEDIRIEQKISDLRQEVSNPNIAIYMDNNLIPGVKKAEISEIIKALKNSDAAARINAISDLEFIKNDQSFMFLCEALRDSDAGVRERAARALLYNGSQQAILVLRQTLLDPEERVRWQAAQTLGHLGDERAIPTLLENLDASDVFLSWRAAAALVSIGSEQVIGTLIQELQSQSPYFLSGAASVFRMISSRALNGKKVGLEKAIAPLWQARMKHPDEREIGEAIAAIQSRCGFYNYDLYQQAQELEKNLNMSGSDNDSLGGVHKKLDSIESKVDAMSDEPKRVIHTQKYFEKVETYNENNYASDPKFSESLTEILRILETLQQQNPTATTEQANAIIEAEFREIQLHQPDRWKLLRQQLLNRERWFNGGKSALVEAAQSLSNTIGLNVLIAFLDGFSADD